MSTGGVSRCSGLGESDLGDSDWGEFELGCLRARGGEKREKERRYVVRPWSRTALEPHGAT